MMLIPIKELDIYGVFVPPLLIWGTLSLFIVMPIHAFLARRGFYRSDVERQIFDLSLCIIITGLFSFLVR